MPNRMISLERNTNETQIDLTLDLDGTGRYEVDTGCILHVPIKESINIV